MPSLHHELPELSDRQPAYAEERPKKQMADTLAKTITPLQKVKTYISRTPLQRLTGYNIRGREKPLTVFFWAVTNREQV